jgi:hypothetical protein
VLKKKCPAIETVIQYKPGAGGGLMWAQMNQLAGDGLNIVGINLPHIVFQPLEGQVQYKTEEVTPVFWFHYTPDALVVPDASHIRNFQDYLEGDPRRTRQADARRLGPQLGQPCGARAPECHLRHPDHLHPLQGHRRHVDRHHRRPHRRRLVEHGVPREQQGQGARARGGDGKAPSAAPDAPTFKNSASTGDGPHAASAPNPPRQR